MEQFTLDEAQRWIGRTVMAKTAWNAGSAPMAAEQQGTVIGVQGEHTLQGAPCLCLVVQLWPEKHGDVPNVFFVPKPTFNKHLCPSHTVEEPLSYEHDPAAGERGSVAQAGWPMRPGRRTPTAPRQRTHLVQQLLKEALLMQGVLEEAMAAKHAEGKQVEGSPHITDDEPNPTPASTVQETHASWEKIWRGLREIHTELEKITHAEQHKREWLTSSA